MRRRELLATLGSAAAAWPLIVRAQQPAIPVIGFLGPTETWDSPEHEAAFYAGLAEAGYTEGRNVAIDYRWCGGRYDRLPGMADDLVRRSIAVIVAWGYPCLAAAREATTTIPIVFYYGGDPVRDGIVASFKRPGGNITGATLFNNEIGAKRLQLLRTLLPKAALIGFIINPANPTAEPQLKDVEAVGRAAGLTTTIARASTEPEIETAFASLAEQRVDGLLLVPDPYLFSKREKIVALATQYAIPAIFGDRQWAEAGGLISYASDSIYTYRQVGAYTGRVLAGTKPADLPIVQGTRFVMVINLKTAKALGLTVPQLLLAQADEVIE
jgi:putative ABC transport system substrate-binding protein